MDGGGAGATRRQRRVHDGARHLRSRFALPLGHSSLWFRHAAGFSPHDRNEPFANFFFGGFGNNYVDHGTRSATASRLAFPGAELNEIGGRNFVKSTIEWNLPPLRFRRARHAGLLRDLDAAGACSSAALATNLDDGCASRRATSAGRSISSSTCSRRSI